MPSDWAWLFLRRSSDYVEKYQQLRREGVKVSGEGYGELCIQDRDISLCQDRFGLGVWINPDLKRLPRRARCVGNSFRAGFDFFAPLSTPLFEGGALSPNSFCVIDQYINESKIIQGGVVPVVTPMGCLESKYPNVGFSRITLVGKKGEEAPCVGRFLYAGVNCSVPVFSQLESLKVVARRHRDIFMNFGYKTRDDLVEPKIVSPLESDLFRETKISLSSELAFSSGARSEQWRIVCVDVLGPISKQLDCLSLLLDEYCDRLSDSLKVDFPLSTKRFPKNFPSVNGFSPGNYLKGLLIINDLKSEGLTDFQVAREICKYGAVAGKTFPEWHFDFTSAVDRYVEEAAGMVGGGYRALVYCGWPRVARRGAARAPSRGSELVRVRRRYPG